MAVREWANSHPKTVTGIAAALVVCCVGFVAFEMMGDRRPTIGVMPDHYFTTDDGKSFFATSGTNIPPFDYQGRPAVRVRMFEADGKRFVGYLERYTPEAKKAKVARTITPQQEMDGREMKKPGDANWFSTSDHAAVGRMVQVTPPFKSSSVPVPVEP